MLLRNSLSFDGNFHLNQEVNILLKTFSKIFVQSSNNISMIFKWFFLRNKFLILKRVYYEILCAW